MAQSSIESTESTWNPVTALLVGENWTSIEEVAAYFGEAPGEQLDMSFDFDLSAAILAALASGRAESINDAMCARGRHYPPHALDATFLTNHDMKRIMTQLGGDPGRARLAAGLLLTLPGVPFLYYGEEVGLANGPGGDDPEKRRPMQWTADGGFSSGRPWKAYGDDLAHANVAIQQADPQSLWHHYRRLIALRHREPALARGSYLPRRATGDAAKSVLAFERRDRERSLLVVANLADEALAGIELDLPQPLQGAPETLFAGPAGARLEGAVVGPLPPFGLAVFELPTEVVDAR